MNKRTRVNKSHTVKERYYFYDEQGYIFRTEAGGKFWSVSFWVPEEKKEYRKSLKTKDRDEALIRARDQFLTVQGKIKNNILVWDKTVSVLITEYLDHQNQQAESRFKTKGRVGTIRSQLKHFSDFVKPDTKINDIEDDYFLNYVSYRRNKEPSVRDVTLVNEKASFRSLLTYCQRRGYVSKDRDWDFGPIKKTLVRRDMIELKDYKTIYKCMRTWGKKEDDEKRKEQKEFVRNFILILANTGMRFGEVRKLQWKDVQIRKPKEDPSKKVIRIHLIPEKTKNSKERIVIGRSGPFMDRLKRLSKWTKPDDYIFVDNDTGKQIDKKVYYKLWKEIMEKTKLHESGYTYYGLRHSYATWRLASGVNILELSKVLGCTVKFIEDHYGHVNVDKMMSYYIKEPIYDEDGEIIWGGSLLEKID